MMHEILKPYINEYASSNNILQEAHEKAKADLFGNPEESVKYTYAIAKAIEEMSHTVMIIFTNQCKTMKTVNALVLNEELGRKKVEKLTMTRDKHREYVKIWKKDSDIFLCNALGLQDGPQYKILTGVMIAPSTSKNQVHFLQEVIDADAAHMSFGKCTLYSVYASTANDNMSALGFAMLFGNEDKHYWTHFWKFIKNTHPIFDQSNKTIIIGQNKGYLVAINDIVPSAGRFHCSFHHQQNLVKKCSGRKGHKALTAYNLLSGYKSVASLTATRKKYKDRMHPTDHHHLFNIANEMQFPAARCTQSIQFACMANQGCLVWNQ
jgi:hypothetical protein